MQTEAQSIADIFEIEIADHGMRALLHMTRPVKPGVWRISAEDVSEYLLQQCRLTHILEDRLPAICNRVNRIGLPFEPVTVSDHGTLPVHGQDGSLEWLEDASAPEADDAVNYFTLADFRPVKAGQVFARLIAPTTGVEGINVLGEKTPARPGKPLQLAPGDNVVFDEPSGEFTALVDGRAEIACGKLSVSRVLDIARDIGPATGNIEFAGIVNVPGCVTEHFTVRAEDGVRVGGLVESAHIASGGTVIMKGGMNGRDQGSVTAAGDVVAKFLTNSNVEAGGEVLVNSEIISSRVHARRVVAPAGAIAGGQVTAEDYIEAGQAGNEHGMRTVLAVNFDNERHKKAEATRQEASRIEKAVRLIRDNLRQVQERLEGASENSAQSYFRLLARVEQLEGEMEDLKARHAELSKPEKRRDGMIVVHNGIHSGVVLRIGRYEKPVLQHYPGKHVVYFDEDRYEIVIG